MIARDTKLFIPGDIIPGSGMVDSYHCGMPWIPTMKGPYVYGVVKTFHGWLCDAKTGKRLSHDEVINRTGNKAYDYEDKAEDVKGWRLRNFDAVVEGELKIHSTQLTKGQEKRWRIWQRAKMFLTGRLRRRRKELTRKQ